MSYFEFPHTRTYDTDLGWLIKKVKELADIQEDFIKNNVIHFADPITWDITKQYIQNTVVVDSDGTAYISKQPVPAGISLNNTDYWLPIYNYSDFLNKLRDQIAHNNEDTPYTTEALSAGDLIFYDGILYKLNTDLPAGSQIIPGTNAEQTTIETELKNIDVDLTPVYDAIDQEKADREEADRLIQAEIDNFQRIINVSTFGAVGDGVTNDYNAIVNTITYCTENNATMAFEEGKSYVIDGNPINLTCDVDFNNATLIMNDKNETMFTIGTLDENTQVYDMSNTTSFNIGIQALYGKAFVVTTDVSMGERHGGSGGEYFYTQYMICDDNGDFINTNLQLGVGAGHTATISNVVDYKIATIDIGHVNLEYDSGYSEAQSAFTVYRPNVKIHDIFIKSSVADTSLQSHCVRIDRTCFAEVYNITGNNISSDDAHSTYLVAAIRCSNVYMHDCQMVMGWGTTGYTFVTNCTTERVICNRLDLHYGTNGYITYSDCIVGGNRGYAAMGMGYAVITFNNCVFLGAKDYPWCVEFRNDFGIPFRHVSFNDCSFYQRTADSAAFAIYSPIANSDMSLFNINDMQITFNRCTNNAVYFFNTANTIITPYVTVTINDCIIRTGRRILGNTAAAIKSLKLNGIRVESDSTLNRDAIASGSAVLIFIDQSRINIAFPSTVTTANYIITNCFIYAAISSRTSGAVIFSNNMIANGVTVSIVADNGLQNSNNLTLTA